MTRKFLTAALIASAVSSVQATPLTSTVSGTLFDINAGSFLTTHFGADLSSGTDYRLHIAQEFNESFPPHGQTSAGVSTIYVSVGGRTKIFYNVPAQQAWSVLSNGNYQQTFSSFWIDDLRIAVANTFMVPDRLDPANRFATYSFSSPSAAINSSLYIYDRNHAFKEGIFGIGRQVDLNSAKLPDIELPESHSLSLFALGLAVLTYASHRKSRR